MYQQMLDSNQNLININDINQLDSTMEDSNLEQPTQYYLEKIDTVECERRRVYDRVSKAEAERIRRRSSGMTILGSSGT